jgi:hypothetical protein
MAEAGSWPGIRRNGLRSTTALLDLFEIGGPRRVQLEALWRPESERISHPAHGTAVIRDQKPMPDVVLEQFLEPGLSTAEWYQLINGKTFFWPNPTPLLWMLGAAPYRNRAHDVLVVDTARLVQRHEDTIRLSAQNSGSTHKGLRKSRNTFQPISEFREPYVNEVAVEYSVPDIEALTLRVESRKGPDILGTVWPT